MFWIRVIQGKLIKLTPNLKSKDFICTSISQKMYRAKNTAYFLNLRE